MNDDAFNVLMALIVADGVIVTVFLLVIASIDDHLKGRIREVSRLTCLLYDAQLKLSERVCDLEIKG